MDMKYCFIAVAPYVLPLAKHLQDEGREVVMCVIEDSTALGLGESKESPKHREERITNYDGVIEKKTLPQTMDFLSKIKNKDEWFLYFDFHDLYKISERCLDMGFHQGSFPTEFYHRLEQDRAFGKKFAKRYYPHIEVEDAPEFKTIADGIAYLKKSEKAMVLKSNGKNGRTVVPPGDEKISDLLLIDVLKKNRKAYESDGFILEDKILNPLELTPVMIFYDGKPVYSLVEFENKELGAGNIGIQKGGNCALSVRTDINAKINEIAFPPIIHELAQEQPGMSTFDAGLLFSEDKFYFTEMCGMRAGWCGFLSQIVMRDKGDPFVADYFEDIIAGRSPLLNKYGVYVRIFHYDSDNTEAKLPQPGIPMWWDKAIERNLFLYQNRKEGDLTVTANSDMDFVATITGADDDMRNAAIKTYNRVDKFIFEKMYYRPKFDFLSTDYPTSIPNRLNALLDYL